MPGHALVQNPTSPTGGRVSNAELVGVIVITRIEMHDPDAKSANLPRRMTALLSRKVVAAAAGPHLLVVSSRLSPLAVRWEL